ncbi:pleiotropic drug resistance ABC transporter [Ramaria rubella]|nr:pleiotropic drug resistance ABC transporter [Ramaria rubella]
MAAVLPGDVLRLLLTLSLTWIAGSLPLRNVLPCSYVATEVDIPSNKLSSPEDRASLWTWLTFSFVNPILELAHQQDELNPWVKRTLNEEDVWSLPPTFLHRNLFRKYLAHRKSHPNQSLIGFLLQSNSLDLIIDVSVELWRAFVGFVPSYALQQILSLLSSNSSTARSQAYLYTLLTFVAHMSFAQLDLFQGWHTRRCYERTRGQLFCALHWKALRRRDISGRSRSAKDGEDKTPADLGKVVNLMQGDTYAVAHRFWDFSAVFAAPVRLIIALVFLYRVLGRSSLAGVLVVIIAWVLNYPLARWNVSITRSSWKAKDKRMNGVNELFQNIRFLKFYGWDTRWAHKVNEFREIELSWRVKEAIVDTLISFIWTWVPSATALFAFMSYTLIDGQELTVSKAFVSVALFEQLQAPLTALPEQVFSLLHGESYVSMQRIEAYLAEEEVPSWASSLRATEDPDNHNVTTGDNGRIGFEHANFEWHRPVEGAATPDTSGTVTPHDFRLTDLNILFPIGKLTLISGRTGSGKTALLNALLGEMHWLSGTVYINKQDHRFAFCGQNPWLEHATIKNNILYGSDYDPDRYSKVLQVCALEKDLLFLPAGDLTEIGEKGVTLSGGQRSRIALARAVYSRAECILLDDPLAAVDMHTARHIYEQCISGDLLRGRTVILVTHHLALCLPNASYLIELSGGQIAHQGNVEDLRRAGHLGNTSEDKPDKTESDDVSSLPPNSSTPLNEADLIPGEEKRPRAPRAQSGKLVEAEVRAEGRVKISTYLTYFRAGGWFAWALTLVLMIAIRAITLGNQMFLAQWGEAYSEKVDTEVRAPILEHLPPPAENVRPWLLIFLVISLSGAFSVLFYIALGYYASLRASRRLFVAMLFRLSHAPIRFFDITPMGRVLNRFVTDFGTVDGALTDSARAALSGVLTFVFSFATIVVLMPTFLPFAIMIAYLYLRLVPRFLLASRDLRRLELTSLSPTFAGFDELLAGLSHVRAFAMESTYQDRFYKKVDKFQSFDHVYWLLNIWMKWRYDCLGSVVVFCATVFSLWSGVESGHAAVVIVQAGVFAESSRQLIKVAALLELDFNSVERISEYLDIPGEAPAIIPDSRPPAYWPSSSGGLVVDKLTVRYTADLPPVLKDLSFHVKPGEKIGVVGRTGAGKSTLALSLLRIVEPVEGRIIVDGVDLSTIGLEDLRTRITIINQDVSLFSGTIRSNIDPFDEHEDHECWDVLKRCHLLAGSSNNVIGPIWSLDTPISQTGSLSAGERQLVALARAILRRSQVVVLDEATSAIDMHLDEMARPTFIMIHSLVQRTIREELAEALVITIAHRLRTIIDYDRVLVLGAEGHILEFDEPKRLLANPVGVFTEMCRQSADWADLKAAI